MKVRKITVTLTDRSQLSFTGEFILYPWSNNPTRFCASNQYGGFTVPLEHIQYITYGEMVEIPDMPGALSLYTESSNGSK